MDSHTPTAARPMNKRQQAKAETRAKLLKTARALFTRMGYEAVTIRTLAKEAGMSTGAVFSCWPDKAAVFREAMNQEPPIDTPERRRAVARRQRVLEMIRGADTHELAGEDVQLLADWALRGRTDRPDALQAWFENWWIVAREDGEALDTARNLARAEIQGLEAVA